MMTRSGQMVMMGDTMEVLYAIEMLINNGQVQEAQAYVQTAHNALTQMAHNWGQSRCRIRCFSKVP